MSSFVALVSAFVVIRCVMEDTTVKMEEMKKIANDVLNMSFLVAMVCVCPGKPDVMVIWIVQITLMKRAVHVVAESSAALMVLVFPK